MLEAATCAGLVLGEVLGALDVDRAGAEVG